MSNRWPETCRFCGAPLMLTRCPRCNYQKPAQTEVRFSGFTGGAGASVRLAGSASFYDATQATDTLTIPNVQVRDGEALFVVTAKNSCEFPNSAETWGSFTSVNNYSWGTPAFQTGAGIETLTPGTNDIVLSVNPLHGVPNPISCVAIVVAFGPALRPTSFDTGLHASFGNSAGSTDATTTTTRGPTQANSMAIASLATNGPNTDNAGTWSNAFTPLFRLGTNGGGTDCTLAVATKLLNSTAAVTVSVNGITSRPWAIYEQPFKLA